ncbi:hypothetical protein J2S49_000332 [Arcanobacterium wilhelmae]|uniref:Cell division protein FtsL n=1 Tax=Arcanobacterium wilhelmae TaxID=1803177 RepID=A0ABT9NAM5_9ACTO|nr:hypothetical protein [Arcanobacterium wilhelmae]MDP9800256.1 hypothetical protein [Arcanobacterium wilhelmae]WFN89695.1 hypothetical protein P8A24_05665 [Arcanobacterium wilhelmae]
MTAVANARPVRQASPVISAPGLSVVPTPAPARGFFGTVALCAAIFLGAMGLAFHLNTLMVQGAYDLKNINVQISEVSAKAATLEKEVISVSAPAQLEQAAKKQGMAPATATKFLDPNTGKIAEFVKKK